MKTFFKLSLILGMFLLGTTSAFSNCGITSGSINILANDFPALRTYTDTAKACAGDGADF